MSKKKLFFEKNTIIKLFNDKKFNKFQNIQKIYYYEIDIDICKLVIVSEINLKIILLNKFKKGH